MIHLDYADGTSAWLTDDQLKEKHPELYVKLRAPVPFAEYGRKLRDMRVKYNFSIKEVAKFLDMGLAAISDIERGKVEAPPAVVDCYSILKFRRS